MPIIEKQISAFFNSTPTTGAVPIGTDGNKFRITLDRPILIPPNAVNCTLETVSAKIWNTSPNISASIGNNHFYFSFGGQDYDVLLADGLYAVSDLSRTLSMFFVNNGLSSNFMPLHPEFASEYGFGGYCYAQNL